MLVDPNKWYQMGIHLSEFSSSRILFDSNKDFVEEIFHKVSLWLDMEFTEEIL